MAKLQGDAVAQWGWWIADKDDVAGAGDINLRCASIDTSDGSDRPAGRTAFPEAGEATYSGKALGQYAVVDGEDSESGAFEATASLTAKFSGTGGAETKLSGSVHDFDVHSGWEVMLKENTADRNGTSGLFTGNTVWKTGDDDGLGEGNWQASAYGGANGAEPDHVVGGFTAVDAGARMVGVFGGEPPKQE